MNIYRHANYLCSVHHLTQLPVDTGYEVAFAGRSNSGKSSAINAITAQQKLAKVSKTPGRTQQLNFFTLDGHRRLVDLPGYGFAQVPLTVKQHWQRVLSQYLYTRESLQGLILLMDIRHPLTPFDHDMLCWCQTAKMSVHILLTKADKLSYGKGNGVLQQVRRQLASWEIETSVQLFSSLKQQGIEEVHRCLDTWFKLNMSST